MNEHLHSILDGAAPRPSADSAEASEVAEAEALISRVLRAIPARSVPDLAPAVLERIAAAEPVAAVIRPAPVNGIWHRLASWLWSPQPVHLSWRPAYAFVFAFLMFGAGALTLGRSPAAVADSKQILVQFRLDAPAAANVALAGNFTNWQPTVQLTRAGGGVWTVVVPLEEGVHKYAFVIDGKLWQADPYAPAVADGFGGENSQIAVLSPDAVTKS